MTTAKWAMVAYGIAMIGLGFFAFIQKHSLPSLLGGGFIGLLVLAMVKVSFSHPRIGYAVAAVAALAMVIQFGVKLLKPDPSWQAYTIPALSIALIAVLVGGHVMTMSRREGE